MIGSSRICLSMIVKDEARVILRCLASVKPYLDHWIIADTGSTDGTQEVVRNFMADLPGELLERSWVDFAYNRNEAIEAARGKGEYLLVIDADETLKLPPTLRSLNRDCYFVTMQLGEISYHRIVLVSDRVRWRYIGVLHEYLFSRDAQTSGFIPEALITSLADGARSCDPEKYRKDALVLEAALLTEPDNERYVFYLAQSYRDAGEDDAALRHYRRRVAMGGWAEEVWYAQYQIAEIEARRGREWPTTLEAYLAAFQLRPERAEPLFRVAKHYMQERQFDIADLFLCRAAGIAFPAKDSLFVEHNVYRFLIPIEIAVCAYYLGDHSKAIRLNDALLTKPDLPLPYRELVIQNRQYSLDAIHPPTRPDVVRHLDC